MAHFCSGSDFLRFCAGEEIIAAFRPDSHASQNKENIGELLFTFMEHWNLQCSWLMRMPWTRSCLTWITESLTYVCSGSAKVNVIKESSLVEKKPLVE